MRNVICFVCGVLLFLLASCGGATKFDKARIASISKVAVVVYTVPDKIEYKEDPKEEKGGLSLQAVAKAVAKDLATGKGEEAATISLEAFINTINQQGLPFEVISKKEMMSNSEFTKLYIPPVKEEKPAGVAGMAMGMLGGGASITGVGPVNLNAYGLQDNWWEGQALTGGGNEMEYIKSAIEALNVDAALVINDRGYSFSCKACVGAGGVMNGNASTGSAFIVSLVAKDGAVLANIRQWFGSTSGGAAMVSSMVNPLQHTGLYQAHGEKTAMLFAEEFKAALTKEDK
ncbi:hypothetical protein KKA14_17745 [bacterium]|nr:hypothetical protein [bacterium]